MPREIAVRAKTASASSPDLPAHVIFLVLTFLVGDLASLCAATCINRSWRKVAKRKFLWRNLDFSDQLEIASRLTDKHLKTLVRRAGDKLVCLNLVLEDRREHIDNVTLKGVFKALSKAPLLDKLGVRGLRYDHVLDHQSLTRHDKLRELVRPGVGLLDAWRSESDGRIELCDAEIDGATCSRICGIGDKLCEECRIYRCRQCRDIAEAKRVPPCNHLCDSCLQFVGTRRFVFPDWKNCALSARTKTAL